jgi:hypothetical protein
MGFLVVGTVVITGGLVVGLVVRGLCVGCVGVVDPDGFTVTCLVSLNSHVKQAFLQLSGIHLSLTTHSPFLAHVIQAVSLVYALAQRAIGNKNVGNGN